MPWRKLIETRQLTLQFGSNGTPSFGVCCWGFSNLKRYTSNNTSKLEIYISPRSHLTPFNRAIGLQVQCSRVPRTSYELRVDIIDAYTALGRRVTYTGLLLGFRTIHDLTMLPSLRGV